jgi:hypothetical protein
MAEGLVERQRAALEPRFERLPFQQLHHQVVGALVMADVVHRADVRVVQARNGSRFALESFPALRIPGHARWQNFDRHYATQPRVACAIHLTHPASAERGLNLVRAELRAWINCQESVSGLYRGPDFPLQLPSQETSRRPPGTYDSPAFAATSRITIEMIGKMRTIAG